ncbi:MAG: hypothetical protein QUS07_08725 [Methanothrix sp.]|nr:hypothetical protein [Methanothrix sp.]
MRTAFAVVVCVLLCLLAAQCHAQSTSRFQSVGGDFGQTWISNFKAANPEPAQESSNGSDLWSWGGAPKGSIVVNGKLQADPYYYWKSLNFTNGWLGETSVDPYTGNPVYGYVDPNTGFVRYFYVDPSTGKPVYVNYDPATGTPTYGSVSPFYASNDWSGNYALPSVFNSNSPWG